MPFISGPDGDLKTAFVSDAFLLDQFVGNTLFNWGNNASGQLGDNTVANKSNPVQTVTGGINWKQVACGAYFTAAIKTDNTLWSWGSNSNGYMGDNTITHRSSPVQTVAGGTNWKQVSCHYFDTAAIKTDGTLWCWGNNNAGTMGDNTTTNRSSPVQTVTFGTNWKQVSVGMRITAAIKTDGTLWTWGANYYGQLGDNTTTNRSSPVQTVTFGTNWKQVACGYEHMSAIKTDGTLWSWGGNNGYYSSMLGDNTLARRSSPVQTIAFGTNWKQVSCGRSNTAAIKTDGTLWNWGSDGTQIGDNTGTKKSSPVQTVAYGTNWKQVACGNTHTAAIKTDGTLWIWGKNSYGQLGDNTTGAKASPVQTTAYGTNWKQVAGGCANNTAAITNGDI